MKEYMWCKRCERAFLQSKVVERDGEWLCAFAPQRIDSLTGEPVRSCSGKLSVSEPWEKARQEALKLDSRWAEKPVHGETYRIKVEVFRLGMYGL